MRAILQSYAEILFLQGTWVGAVLFAILLVKPGTAAAGVLSVLAAYLFARFIGMGREFLQTGYYTYNALLVGLSVGYLFEVDLLPAFLALTLGVLSLVLTVGLASAFSRFLVLPVLSVPFLLVSSLLYLASWRYSGLLVAARHGQTLTLPGLPAWADGFLRSFGAIFFAPDLAIGLVAGLLVLVRSRILFALALGGYAWGTWVRAGMLGSYPQAYADVYSLNFILIAMALGGVFLVPSAGSFFVAAVGVAVSTVLLDATSVFWASYGVPAFTLPFNAVCLTFLYAMGLAGSPLIARYVKATPEETLDHHLSVRMRHPGSERTLFLPFAGRWKVWQAFDGAWTHKGLWRHAYDFVVVDDQGRTERDEGTRLEDYFAYKKPVLSPVRGRVVRVVDGLPDNPIGQVDRDRSWGNVVIICDPRGFHVELSHLAQRSAAVKEGDWVERGARLGLCGNSGLSPQPHIHVQVQATDAIGGATLPFSFVSFTDGALHHANDLPALDSLVEPLYLDARLDASTNHVPDGVQEFEVVRAGRPAERLKLEVRMAVDGTPYLDSGSGRLYFGKHEGTFYFHCAEGGDRRLEAIMRALPRLPMAFREGLSWTDVLPLGVLPAGPRRMAAQFLRAFFPGLGCVRASQRFVSPS
ncbi:MAG: urea transporter, partial [Candidatus Riflebacteria bacterium]|nr:urea transporter [Candidatus Riflebacteria bacterium]